MENEQTTNEQNPPSSTETWKQVGEQFKSLGESLATAFRAAWQDEENRQRIQDMQNGLEAMVSEIGGALKDSMDSPETQRVRQQAGKVAETVRTVSEQAAQEVRPHLLSSLRQLNANLQNIIEHMEQNSQTAHENKTAASNNEEHSQDVL